MANRPMMRSMTYDEVLALGDGDIQVGMSRFIKSSEWRTAEDYDAIAAELVLAKDALRIVQETSIEHAGKQNDRIHALETSLAAELALRQTAEGYAARNALRVIAVEADNEWLREGLRGIAKMDIKTEADRMVLWAKDTLSGRATDLPQTETKGDANGT